MAKLRRAASSLTLQERFVLLHELGIFAGAESRSGDGSSLSETRALRETLPGLLGRHRVRSLLDIPCGDMHWMQEVPLEGIDYTGADIVPAIVKANRERLERPGRRFLLLDATSDPLPEVDLIFCRDLLIHLSLEDIARTLANFVTSGSRLLMTSHFARRRQNRDITSGDFRPVNLCAAPFHLPPPLTTVSERSRLKGRAFADRAMALWSLADLPSTFAV